jgi:hypothetical protein
LPSHPLSRRRRRFAAGAAAAAALAPAGAAQAAETPCADESLQQAFAAWGDSDWYFLAPGGGFEDGAAGWSLSGGAALVGSTDPFGLGGAADRRALALARGATATSAPFCIRPDSRTVRWVQRGPQQGGVLLAEVVHLETGARSASRVVDVVRGSGDWQPSRRVSIPLWGTGAREDGFAIVALRFTALSGGWAIDDLFVDPKMRH